MGLQAGARTVGFLHWFWGSNSGPHSNPEPFQAPDYLLPLFFFFNHSLTEDLVLAIFNSKAFFFFLTQKKYTVKCSSDFSTFRIQLPLLHEVFLCELDTTFEFLKELSMYPLGTVEL